MPVQEAPGKLQDFERNPSYERRVVVFYDVLGWRSHIERAGQDAEKIGELRRSILLQTRTMSLRTHWNISVSTFSDNIVISQPLGQMTQRLIAHLAISQITLGLKGLLLRGGVTIGEIVHDEECVFGPGLNRAYELESKIARFPRFILDPDVLPEFGNLGDLPVTEDGVTFLDPFRIEYIEYLRRSGQQVATKDAVHSAGVPYEGGEELLGQYDDDEILKMILDLQKPQIRSALPDRDWEKVAWVYDRLAGQLGLPPSRSYPRVYPPAVVD